MAKNINTVSGRQSSAIAQANAKANPGGKMPMDELGVTGLKRTGNRGLVYEEFLLELQGERARRVYREMRDNDPVIGAMLFAVEMLSRNVHWRLEGDHQESVDFVEGCMEDMSHTWEDFISEVLSMLTFGFSWHEVIYKRRLGGKKDASSRFDDGKIGWRKFPIRAQESLLEWVWDDEGGIQSFVQLAPPHYQRVEIPIDRSLLFRVGIHKGNPEGRSMLRNAYRPWWFKKRIEEIEGIGIERDLAGIPTIYRTAEIADMYDASLKEILRNVRRDEQEGLLLPLAYDDKGNKLLTFELLSSAGNRQLDVNTVIDRYNKSIAMTCLADFIMLGQSARGSFALSVTKSATFAQGLGAILKSIAAVFNRVAIPKLLKLNGMSVAKDDLPRIVPGDVEPPDLASLGAYITSLSGAGAPLFPDEELENYCRQLANLPEKSEDAINLQTATAEANTPVPALAPGQKAPKGKPGAKVPVPTKKPKQNAQDYDPDAPPVIDDVEES